jgi:hypothetical protein
MDIDLVICKQQKYNYLEAEHYEEDYAIPPP